MAESKTKPAYVYSTLSNDQNYVSWGDFKEGGKTQREQSVQIRGKANIANKNLITKKGVCTKITTDQLEVLKKVRMFKDHVQNGFITVTEKMIDAEDVAKEHLKEKDQSAPLAKKDLESDGKGKVRIDPFQNDDE